MNIRAKIFGGGRIVEEKPVFGSKKPLGAKADALDSVSVHREEGRRSNGRSEDRHRLSDEQVRITHDGRSHKAGLVNLSGGGAMIAGDFQPKLWDRVDLHLGDDGVIECAVRWLKGDRVGLEFAHETRLDCSADEQAVLLREVVAHSFPDLDFEPQGAVAAATPTAKLDKSQDKRRERRHPLIWSGSLHHDYQTTTVRLRNISSTGALVECQALLRVGTEPLLDLGDAGQIFAVVSWVVGDQAGLKFNKPFDLTRLSRARPEITPRKWVRPAYLSSEPASDSPWAEEWGRMSLGELREDLEGFMKR